jgi:hypothetical protein
MYYATYKTDYHTDYTVSACISYVVTQIALKLVQEPNFEHFLTNFCACLTAMVRKVQLTSSQHTFFLGTMGNAEKYGSLQ